MARETLLIMLRPEFDEIFIFNVKHKDNVDPREAFEKAFKDYAKTEDGEEYIAENGSNWGDAIQMPFKHLIKYGILTISQRNDDGILVVQHDDSLLDEDSVSD